jgi:hypothetical protein
MLREADVTIDELPPNRIGRAVLDKRGALFRGTIAELADALGRGGVQFHAGAIRGALPQIVSS